MHDHILLCPCHFSCIRAQNSWCLITDELLGSFHFAEYGPRPYLLHNIQILLKDKNINFFIGSSITVVTVVSEYSHKTPESLLSSLFWLENQGMDALRWKITINLKWPVWDSRSLTFQNITTIKQRVFKTPNHWLVTVNISGDGNKNEILPPSTDTSLETAPFANVVLFQYPLQFHLERRTEFWDYEMPIWGLIFFLWCFKCLKRW